MYVRLLMYYICFPYTYYVLTYVNIKIMRIDSIERTDIKLHHAHLLPIMCGKQLQAPVSLSQTLSTDDPI